VPVTVLSPRTGLVMNLDAKVKLHGAQVGKVDSIESLPNGQAAIHLAMDPSRLHLIPANTLVDIASTTVFGSKFIELVPRPNLRHSRCAPARCCRKHVTVEITRCSNNWYRCCPRSNPRSSTRPGRIRPERLAAGARS